MTPPQGRHHRGRRVGPRSSKEIIERAAGVSSAFEIGKVAAISEGNEPGARNRSCNMLGDRARNEVVIPKDDQRRNAERLQPRQQIVPFPVPAVGHQPVFDRPGLHDAFLVLVDESHSEDRRPAPSTGAIVRRPQCVELSNRREITWKA